MDTGFAPPSSIPNVWNELISEAAIRGKDSYQEFLSLPAEEGAETPSAWSVSALKRCLDFAAAALALLLFWPLLAIAAILVRLGSPGPVIFRQERVGLGGVLFTVFKFRTMSFAAQAGGPSLTKRGDPRVTRFGAFLRKYKLDELPQLINVLRGEMSFIGPRPKVAHLEVAEMPFRPGITGAATLAFRCEEDLLQDIPDEDLEEYYCRTIKPLKAKIDWDYMRRATLVSDIALLYRTAASCLSTNSEILAGIDQPALEALEAIDQSKIA